MKTLRVGSLFSGFGLMDYGLEQAGMEIVFQVEINDYARGVLGKHWPGVPVFSDICDVRGCDLPACDVLAGGFPCTDLSNAGRRAGIDGGHSGLWREFARLIGELRPRYVLVENVTALLGRGMGRVLGDLSTRGYDAEWDCLPASAFGASHRRDRLFLIAYPARGRWGTGWEGRPPSGIAGQSVAIGALSPATDADGQGLQGLRPARMRRRPVIAAVLRQPGRAWATEPDVVRMVYGCPNRVERIRGLGNGCTPPQAEYVGRLIIAHAASEETS